MLKYNILNTYSLILNTWKIKKGTSFANIYFSIILKLFKKITWKLISLTLFIPETAKSKIKKKTVYMTLFQDLNIA